MGKQLWSGRFSKSVDEKVFAFNQSLTFDARLYREDIMGSIAHAKMLGKCKIIDEKDAQQIVSGLNDILNDIEKGTLPIIGEEDIHTFIENELTARIGTAGKKLHTGRSRNDQVAVDMRMYARKSALQIKKELLRLIKTITALAEKNKSVIMSGYTHLQRAQPITFAHQLMAYAFMFVRDASRISDSVKRANECPLGSGALAGTSYPIDREMTAKELAFDAPTANSIDGVSDRDYLMELLCDFSIIMTHLSRFSEEIILWCSQEFAYVELDDAYATGSSIMPQKKNPDIPELVRGKSGRVIGSMTGFFTLMKGLPLAYNKDMQEDKEAFFDAADTVFDCISIFSDMLENLKVNAKAMERAAAKGFINATDCADYLVGKGAAFRDAYKTVGKIVAYCIEKEKTIEELSIEEFKQFDGMFEKDIYLVIDLKWCVEKRRSQGGASPDCLKEQFEKIRKALGELE